MVAFGNLLAVALVGSASAFAPARQPIHSTQLYAKGEPSQQLLDLFPTRESNNELLQLVSRYIDEDEPTSDPRIVKFLRTGDMEIYKDIEANPIPPKAPPKN